MANISKVELNGTTYNINTSGSIPESEKGAANGVASLDSTGKVPSSQLPSYVDDVLEYSAKSSFPATGETGKIYVDTSTNKTYRWSGSAYVEVSKSLALGETSSTAYRGDRGKAAYDHSQTTSGNPHNVTKSDVGLGNVGNFKAVSTAASQGLSNTEKSNARANIGAGTGNGTYSKPSGGIPKSDLASAVQTSLDQVNTNKTNILYALEKVGKNNFNYAYVGDGNNFGKSFTSAHATFEIQSDNTALKITTDGAVTTGNPYIFFTDETGNYINFKKWFDGRHYLTGIPSGASTRTHRIFYKADSQVSVSLSTDTLLPDLSTATNIYIGIQVQTGQNYGSTGILYQPMIILDTLYASDPSYEPAALPNYDLTRLEAEDRAALAEEIDAGPKNIIVPYDVTYPVRGMTLTYSSDGVLVTGTATENPYSYIKTGAITIKAGVTYAVYDSAYTNNNTAYFYVDSSTAFDIATPSITNEARYLVAKNSGTFHIYMRVPYNVTVNKLHKPMICTKAAFGVSQKFVPYRPDLDLVYSSLQCDVKYAKVPVSTSYSLIGSIKTKGNRVCRITVTQEYAAVAPTGLILSKSNQSSDFNTLTNMIAPPVETTTDNLTLTISTLCYFTYDRVIYIWAKAKTASTNGNNFMALCEHFGDIDGVTKSMS